MFGVSLQNLRLTGLDPRGDPIQESTTSTIPHPTPFIVSTERPSQVSPIKGGVLALCTDSDLALTLLEATGITATVCNEIGADATAAVPFLGLIAAPLYLHHAVKSAYERLKLMVEAIKTKNVASAVFWAGRGLDAFGTALGNTSKTVAAALDLAKLGSHAVAALLMLKVIPISLIVIGAISWIFEAWALVRSVKALSEFNHRAASADEDLEKLADLFKFLRGPKPEASELVQTEFQGNFFSKDHRVVEIKQRIEDLFSHQELKLAETMRNAIYNRVDTQFADDLESIGIISGVMESLSQGEDEVRLLHRLLALKEAHPNWLTTQQWAQLEQLRQKVLEAGNEITETMRSEIHRVVFYSTLSVLLSMLSVVSGSMVMIDPSTQSISTFMSISGGAINMSSLIFDKAVDQKSFHRMSSRFRKTRKVLK